MFEIFFAKEYYNQYKTHSIIFTNLLESYATADVLAASSIHSRIVKIKILSIIQQVVAVPIGYHLEVTPAEQPLYICSYGHLVTQ